MKNYLRAILKPEYIFRPTQILKRIKHNSTSENQCEVELPWHEKMTINPNEDVGRAIYHLGFYELPLSELIWRSLKGANKFIDVGTNVGYFPMLALANKNFSGEVHCFEPHPELFKVASKNISSAKNSSRARLNNFALSSSEGQTTLYIPNEFDKNEGIASLEKPQGNSVREITVQMKRLDDLKIEGHNLVLKVDTEGHEAQVFLGAQELLSKQAFKVIFFEEFRDIDKAESFSLLKKYEYEIRKIKRSFLGPKIVDVKELQETKSWEPVNYIACPVNSNTWIDLSFSGWQIIQDL